MPRSHLVRRLCRLLACVFGKPPFVNRSLAWALGLSVLALASCVPDTPREVPADAPVLVDVRAVVGQPPETVLTLLGKPVSGLATASGTALYRDGISVRYRGGRAERVQSAFLGEYRFGPEVLRLFGIDRPPPPTRAENGTLWWENGSIPPFAAVTLHPHPQHGRTVDSVNFFAEGTPADSMF